MGAQDPLIDEGGLIDPSDASVGSLATCRRL